MIWSLLLSTIALAGPVQQLPLLQHEAEPLLSTSGLAWLQLQSAHPDLVAHIASLPEPRLVEYMDGQEVVQRLVTEGQKALLGLQHIKFRDVTDEIELEPRPKPELPSALVLSSDLLKPLLDSISTKRMRDFLTTFSGFRTRYYRSQDGKKSQAWLKAQIEGVIADRKDIVLKEFAHPWGQNSLIVHIPRQVSSNVKANDDLVILSAHQDSTNLLPFLPAPGADDDGSGSTTIFEVLNVLLEHDFVPKNASVEFHWYSAEEGGLLGSQAVAQAYHQENKAVKAMLQFDMTAYVKPGTEERIGLITDFVDPDLTDLLFKICDEYAQIPAVPTKCGYACSDHASWTKTGVRSAFSIESTFADSNTGHIHTTGDTINVPGFSFEHAAQFARIGISYISELSS